MTTDSPATFTSPPAGITQSNRRLPSLAALIAALLLLLAGLDSVDTSAQESDPSGTGPVVYVVAITGTIDLGLAPYLERAIEEAEEADAAALIIEIDTPGGRLDAVLQMQDALLDAQVPTVAFVDRTAFSAGALVAIASERIYMVPGAVMGAATPVTGAGETADAKTISAVRKTFKTTAEVRGRNPLVAEAMVDPAVAIEGLVAEGELLTLTTTEAATWGYTDGIVADRVALLAELGLAEVQVVEVSPGLAERIVRFVTNPVVASLLITGAILLIIGDALVGGFGVIALIGLGMLGTFFWGHMLAGLAGWEDIALVVIGLVLLAVEAFVIPGFGVAGIAGLIALGAGFWLAMVGRDIRTPESTERAGWTVGIALILVVVGGVALMAMIPRMRPRRRGGLVLATAVGDGSGMQVKPPSGWLRFFGGGSALILEREPAPHVNWSPQTPTATLLGAGGVALSDLRPSGRAMVAGQEVDVVTTGDYIPAGASITVIADEGYRRVVRRVEPAAG